MDGENGNPDGFGMLAEINRNYILIHPGAGGEKAFS